MLEFLKDLRSDRKERPLHIVFVCTANCCRSPMAEILFEKMLIDELGSEKALEEAGLWIDSAATYYSGFPMSQKSAGLLVQEEKIASSRCEAHKGKLLSELETPDLILTMTEEHLKAIYRGLPEWDDFTFTLDEFVKHDMGITDIDIEDPISGTMDDFRRIKNQIKADLRLLIDEFKEAGLIKPAVPKT